MAPGKQKVQVTYSKASSDLEVFQLHEIKGREKFMILKVAFILWVT